MDVSDKEVFLVIVERPAQGKHVFISDKASMPEELVGSSGSVSFPLETGIQIYRQMNKCFDVLAPSVPGQMLLVCVSQKVEREMLGPISEYCRDNDLDTTYSDNELVLDCNPVDDIEGMVESGILSADHLQKMKYYEKLGVHISSVSFYSNF